MNTVFNLSGDAGRTFAIDIAGSPHQAMLRSSAYTIKVAYSSLAQTIHSIGKRGGKVVNVRMLSTPMPSVAHQPVAVEATPSPATDDAASNSPESRRASSKSKKR
ncbi:phycobilisome linker polypeptide [Chamaesiphon sp. VAR_48_metabat_403]|uniref:phycobilisome linker polypeptide n=1 Tax=Chamaesiphon sp. VAR_48_metabat_403 TaxID=2964700 RepID=UPI00286E8A67|nr:phycobilisome linker polypeptide [Chamaesiphon sp. VAR_48_metabat_403]